jgi:pimeloyl-ACP methyl ester carboxylesterase
MHTFFKPLFLFIILISACAPPANTPASESDIRLTDCVLKTPGIPSQVDAKCGAISIPEDPSNPNSRQIDLHVAVVEAITRSPEPDPLFLLAGGPGQSAIETYPALASTMFRIHEERDIVLVDQRGTGKSNPLRCLDPEDDTLEEAEVLARLQECPDQLDADLRYYTTDIAMQDLDRVRAALGYETINLYGVSYGTRAALVYLKLFPERVRSMILDAVVDPSFVLYQDASQDGEQALDSFLRRCEADDACHTTYPGLRFELETLLSQLESSPAEIILPHPITGNPLELTVTNKMFTNILFNSLYSPDLVAMLPLAIHQAYEADNYAPLVTQAYLLNAGIYDGMFYAVACTEDAPLLTELQDAEESEGIFEFGAQNFAEVCETWPQGEPPEVVSAPVASDVAVLILSGGADPITPPRHAEELAESLPNSLHLVFEGMGHGNGSSQCGARILDAFIEAGSPQGLDTACVEQVEPPPFFVDFSGPKP